MATRNNTRTLMTGLFTAPMALCLVVVGALCLGFGCSSSAPTPPPVQQGAVGGADAVQVPNGDVAIMVAGQKWTGNTDLDSATLRVVGD